MASPVDSGAAWCSIPIGVWMIFLAGIFAAGAAVFVAWRSNVNGKRQLDDQLERGWQQTVRQLKHEAEQRSKQRVHESEQLSKQLAHDADQRALDQQSALRQRVYLEAAGALLNLHTLVGRTVSGGDDDDDVWASFAHDQERIVQVQLIAGEPLMDAVMLYISEMSSGFLELATLRRRARSEEAVPGGQIAVSNAESDATLRDILGPDEEMSARPPAEPPAPRDQRRAEMTRCAIRLTNLSGKLIAKCLFALRHELGGTSDERRYEQLWQVMAGKMEYVLQRDLE